MEQREGQTACDSVQAGMANFPVTETAVAGTSASSLCCVAMERFFLSMICASAALLVAAFIAANPVTEADGASAQTAVLRLVQR